MVSLSQLRRFAKVLGSNQKLEYGPKVMVSHSGKKRVWKVLLVDNEPVPIAITELKNLMIIPRKEDGSLHGGVADTESLDLKVVLSEEIVDIKRTRRFTGRDITLVLSPDLLAINSGRLVDMIFRSEITTRKVRSFEQLKLRSEVQKAQDDVWYARQTLLDAVERLS